MKKENVLKMVSILTLLFLVLPAVSANIDILDVGTGYDGIDYYGYVDYQNTANYTLSGVISVFIDGNIVSEETLDMPIRYVAGFRCSPLKSLAFPLNMSKGDHTILVHILSQNITTQCTYEYTAEGWETEPPDEEESEVEEEGDWL